MSAKPINLLLVDDDDVDIMAIRRAVRTLELTNPIEVAHNGIEAFEVLRGENGREPLQRPYVIILDLNMPRMNGIEFLRQLRADEQLRDSVVFVLTTSAADDDKQQAYRYNIAGYILKTDSSRTIRDAVRMLSSYWSIVDLPG